MDTNIDPVCGMKVDTEKGRSLEHADKRYYFCSQHCVEKFSADPDKYLNPVPIPASTAISPGGYTCPMHPEIHQDKPGACPKCGMALEPADALSDKPDITEYVCPMHAQIVRSEPGECTLCGMALEPSKEAAI